MFKCEKCKKVIRRVEDIRGCGICQSSGTAASIPTTYHSNDWLTPAIIGYALGGGFSGHSHATVDDTPSFTGGGGDTSGSGAGSSWSDDSRSDSSSSSSSSDYSSSSSDSGSSSSDSSGSGSSD